MSGGSLNGFSLGFSPLKLRVSKQVPVKNPG